MKRVFLVLVALLLAFTVGGCGGSAPTGQRLPQSRLSAFGPTDRAVDLHQLRGPLVVNLWASWCGPCRRDLPYYQQFHQAHPGVKMLGVDWQDPAKDQAAALVKRAGLSYPLVVGSGDQIPAQGLPKLILVDAKGHIAYQGYIEITSLTQLERLVARHLGVDL